MWMLAVDTCSRCPGVALLRDDRLVALVAPPTGEQTSVALFRWVESTLGEAGIGLADVDVYAAAAGPGQFTGLRIGLTMVKGFAEVHARPVVPVDTLEAICESAGAEGWLAPVVDARRGQVFAALCRKQDGDITFRKPSAVLSLQEFLAEMEPVEIDPEGLTIVTPDREGWAGPLRGTRFECARQEVVGPVLAEAVGRCARRKFARGEKVDALHLRANYVRRSDAELLWKEK